MLRIADQWYASDVGRQRQGNEDNFFVRAPVFVVADGMGGANAGEVASEMAVRSFDPELPGGDPAEALVDVIEGANRRIHRRSRAEERSAGMGTTVTAAYVADEEVIVAHVGDSRAYLLRDGELVRLTKDHSLVGELVARGKLTEAQAEAHPQRSVITRALGPEADVEVDVDIFEARHGDVFLLCSDGLTSMVHEPKLKPLFENAGELETLGRRLIDAANEAGGRDNITVILFRLEEIEHGRGDAPAAAQAAADPAASQETTEYDTFEGEAVSGARQGVTRAEAPGGEGADAARPGPADDAVEAEYRAAGTVAVQAIRPGNQESRAEGVTAPPRRTVPLPAQAGPPKKRTKRRRRFPTGAVVGLALVAAILVGGWLATRAVYFVGTDPRDDRTITIFRGLPYDLPLGIRLYERYAGSGVTLDELAAGRRPTFTEHKLRSRDDAENLVIALERGQLDQ
jgi:serine/threonine protein phosphatase PrpC